MKQLLCIAMTLLSFHLHASDYYWVGGAGNWSDLNHWRLGSSVGPIPSIVPSSIDNVFFDAGSGFTTPGQTVTLTTNALCNNMTWANVLNNPAFITTNASFTAQVYGNLVLNPTMYYQVIFSFLGSSAATITSGGNISGQFGMYIDKGSGSLTVTDSLVAPSTVISAINSVNFASGTFNIAGKKMLVYGFGSQNDNVRTLEMTNATVICNSGSNSGFKVTGLNKTVNALGSTVVAFGYNTDAGVYNRTTITSGNGPNTVFVNNSTFHSLTFTPGVGYLYPNIGYNNTIDSVIFNGIGTINGNNTVGYVRFANTGTIANTGNVIGKIVCQNNFTVNAAATTTTVDSLILAPNRVTTFKGTFNINDYLYVDGAPCEAFTELYGDTVAGTVNFAAGAVVDINNVILSGVEATGPVTPIAVDGIDGEGNTGFSITEPAGTGTDLYWVGGSGDWNDKNHWSFTSGGAGGACVPFRNDNVIFNNSSGLTSGGTITTSSSSFCKDMTWAAGVGNVTFNESATASFRIYGSITLQPTVTMNAALELRDSGATTLTTNGGGTGAFQLYVAKTGSGSLTLMDNWINPANGVVQLYSGALNMANRTVSLFIFTSDYNTVRSLDISNATITTNLRWIYRGANKSMISTGSAITVNGTFIVGAPGSNYPRVDVTQTAGENSYDVSGTTFGQLTFTNTSTTSAAAILGGNTLRRLEFKGAGSIGNNTGSNTIDSLILAGSRYYIFRATNTIVRYMQAEATPCAGLTEMRSGNGIAVLAFQSTAVADIDNIYLQGMTATGSITPIALNGADAGSNTGWNITPIAGGARYWVGGSGDWNASSHWSTTSGGAGGACVPTISNDVYFDAGSGFTSASKTVSVSSGNAYCRNVNWTGAANAPIWSQTSGWNIEVWGDSIVLNPAATFNAAVTAKGANAAFMKNTVLGNFDIYIDKPGGSLTLLNNYANTATDIGVVNGGLNVSGLTLNLSGIDNLNQPNVSSINISNAFITAALWRYANTVANHSLNAANSSLNVITFIAAGLQYDTVRVSGVLTSSALVNSVTINKLTFTDPGTTSAVGINGVSNTLGTVEYKGSGGIYGTGNTIGTLTFFPGKIYTFTAGTTTNITGDWFASGTPCNLTEIVSSSTTANAIINKTGGAPAFDYIRVRRITGTGSTPFAAYNHTIDLGNNTNWDIDPYNGASPIYGLGPDTAVTATAFPYVLHTDGFFGAPSSQYTWNNSSTADSLIVSDTGTYSVNVTFPDGCTISDAIHITLQVPLPVTLNSFNASVHDCRAYLNWNISDAVNFKEFIIEKSRDGRHFEWNGLVTYAEGIFAYSYTDKNTDKGTAYYRLKLAGPDGQYTYSNVELVNTDCQQDQVKVYPTLTKGVVYIDLPSGYEGAQVEVYNALGQLVQIPDTKRINHSGMHIISLQGSVQGQYLLKVTRGSDIHTFKVIYQP